MCGSVQGLGVGDGHGVQDLVQQLQSPVQVDLDPARRLLDALPGVVGPPALHEAHPQDAQAAQVVHADARRRRQTCGGGGRGRWKSYTDDPLSPARSTIRALTDGRGDASHRAWPRDVPGHRRRLGCSRRLSRGGLLLHLPVTLTQVEHLTGDDTVTGPQTWFLTPTGRAVPTLM